jgi:hypothetical protein
MSQRDEDLRVLRELGELADDDEEVPEAMVEMLNRMEDNLLRTLSPKQRKFVNDVAKRFKVEPSDGAEEDPDEPEPVRLTAGEIPRGAEVELLVKGRPLKPPGRR